MEKTSRIITSLLLSLIIVCVGSGISILHCKHTGCVQIAQAMSHDHSEHCDDTFSKHDCMDVEVVKLSPTSIQKGSVFNFRPMPIMTAWIADLSLSLCRNDFLSTETRAFVYEWHSPPRQYLNLIQTLLI